MQLQKQQQLRQDCVLEFEWDEDKRRINIIKHEIDFEDAIDVFDGRPAVESPGESIFEERCLTTAVLDDDRWITVIWTRRSEKTRITSARRSRDAEKRAHGELYDGGN